VSLPNPDEPESNRCNHWWLRHTQIGSRTESLCHRGLRVHREKTELVCCSHASVTSVNSVAIDVMRSFVTLAELDQDASGGLGVQEGYLGTTRTDPRLLVDEFNAFFLQFF